MGISDDWSLIDPLTVLQAASLWAGVEPNPKLYLLWPDELRRKVQPFVQMLSGAIATGTLKADSRNNVTARIGDYGSSLVFRADVAAFAKSKGLRPAFLFDALLPRQGEQNVAGTPKPTVNEPIQRHASASVLKRALPVGYVSLAEAWHEYQTQHPEYVVPSSNTIGKVEANWRARHDALIARLKLRLLGAISNDQLRPLALTKDGTQLVRLPPSYWQIPDERGNRFAELSLSTGDVTDLALPAGNQHLDGAQLILEERHWQQWLAREVWAAQAKPAGRDPDPFDETQTHWTLLQATAWVFHRTKDAVRRVTGDARRSQGELTRRHSLLTATVSDGGVTDFVRATDAADALLAQMRAELLVGWGRADGRGNLQAIPAPTLIDARVWFAPDKIGPDPGISGTRWSDVHFKRADVMALWRESNAEIEPSVRRTIAAEGECRAWLVSLMREQQQPTEPKGKLRAEAKSRFQVSDRAFQRAWDRAVEDSGNRNWTNPGRRKSSRRIDTPR
jgi:hypothetical protein